MIYMMHKLLTLQVNCHLLIRYPVSVGFCRLVQVVIKKINFQVDKGNSTGQPDTTIDASLPGLVLVTSYFIAAWECWTCHLENKHVVLWVFQDKIF